jgi:hypothetical protein
MPKLWILSNLRGLGRIVCKEATKDEEKKQETTFTVA